MDLDNNLITNKIKKYLLEQGVDIETLPNNLMTTLVDKLLETMGSGGSGLKNLLDNTKHTKYLFENFEGDTLDNLIGENDTENVTDMTNMFSGAKIGTMPKLNTSNVLYATNMFYKARINDISNINSYDFSKLINTSSMFKESSTTASKLGNMIFPNVTNASYMFGGGSTGYTGAKLTCEELTFPKLTDGSNMFSYSHNLPQKLKINIGDSTREDSVKLNYFLQYNNLNSNGLKEFTLNVEGNLNVEMRGFNSYGSYVEKITLNMPNAKITNFNSFCQAATNLKTLEGALNLINITSSGNVSNAFAACKALENLTLKNIKVSLTIGSGTSYGHLLTLDSLVNTCKECINTGSSLTLTIGSANLEKLASVYVKLTGEAEEDESNPKLPMEVCESTDEGAMLINDYMQLKSWSLA